MSKKVISLDELTRYDGKIKELIPENVSDLNNDLAFISGLVLLEYDVSTWADFQAAYAANKVVYCQVGQRYAFMAYIGSDNVEFQYYRSTSSKSSSAQQDEVYVYKLMNNNTWTTTVRPTSITISDAIGSNLTKGSIAITGSATSTSSGKTTYKTFLGNTVISTNNTQMYNICPGYFSLDCTGKLNAGSPFNQYCFSVTGFLHIMKYQTPSQSSSSQRFFVIYAISGTYRLSSQTDITITEPTIFYGIATNNSSPTIKILNNEYLKKEMMIDRKYLGSLGVMPDSSGETGTIGDFSISLVYVENNVYDVSVTNTRQSGTALDLMLIYSGNPPSVTSSDLYYNEKAYLGDIAAGGTQTVRMNILTGEDQYLTLYENYDLGLSKLAKTGDYNDISNKPNVVTTDTEQTISARKIFSTVPRASADPSNINDLTRRNYVQQQDSIYSPFTRSFITDVDFYDEDEGEGLPSSGSKVIGEGAWYTVTATYVDTGIYDITVSSSNFLGYNNCNVVLATGLVKSNSNTSYVNIYFEINPSESTITKRVYFADADTTGLNVDKEDIYSDIVDHLNLYFNAGAIVSKVGRSGNYNDLLNKPTNIVTTDTDQTISGVKTFSSPPKCYSAPEYDEDLVNYECLDEELSTLRRDLNYYQGYKDGMDRQRQMTLPTNIGDRVTQNNMLYKVHIDKIDTNVYDVSVDNNDPYHYGKTMNEVMLVVSEDAFTSGSNTTPTMFPTMLGTKFTEHLLANNLSTVRITTSKKRVYVTVYYNYMLGVSDYIDEKISAAIGTALGGSY